MYIYIYLYIPAEWRNDARTVAAAARPCTALLMSHSLVPPTAAAPLTHLRAFAPTYIGIYMYLHINIYVYICVCICIHIYIHICI